MGPIGSSIQCQPWTTSSCVCEFKFFQFVTLMRWRSCARVIAPISSLILRRTRLLLCGIGGGGGGIRWGGRLRVCVGSSLRGMGRGLDETRSHQAGDHTLEITKSYMRGSSPERYTARRLQICDQSAIMRLQILRRCGDDQAFAQVVGFGKRQCCEGSGADREYGDEDHGRP